MQDAVTQECFEEILRDVRSEVGESRYALWFRAIRLHELRRGVLVLGVPNRFFADWIGEHFGTLLASCALRVLGTPVTIELAVDPELFRRHRAAMAEEPSDAIAPQEPASAPRGLDAFVVVPENEYAWRAIRYAAEGRQPRHDRILLVGGEGSGKTRLLQGLESFRTKGVPARRTLITDSEKLTRGFSLARKSRTLEAFRERFDAFDLIGIDEVHRLGSRVATQRELAGLLQHWRQAGKQVVLCSRHEPKDVHGVSPGLASVLADSLLAWIEPYAPASLVKIFARGLGDDRRSVPAPVVLALADGCRGSATELRSRLLRAYAYAGLLEERVDVEFLRRHRPELVRARGPGREAQNLIDAVCEAFAVSREDLVSKRKARSLLMPRALAVCVLRDRQGLTLKEIGELMGGRSHTSIHLMHRRYAPLIAKEPRLRELYARIPRSEWQQKETP